MTTMFRDEIVCSVCGEKSEHTVIGSTHAFGSPDLDTRPPEGARSTVYQEIQCCPSCGYCNYDLSESTKNVKAIIESREYKAILENKSLPLESVYFMAASYIEKQLNNFINAAWCAICAAWICDDDNNREEGVNCRLEAISLIKKGESKDQKLSEEPGNSEAITIDLMRRAGLFEEARELADKAKDIEMEDIVKKVIHFESGLIRMKDTYCHRIEDAIADNSAPLTDGELEILEELDEELS